MSLGVYDFWGLRTIDRVVRYPSRDHQGPPINRIVQSSEVTSTILVGYRDALVEAVDTGDLTKTLSVRDFQPGAPRS
jgi:hypothetical protein